MTIFKGDTLIWVGIFLSYLPLMQIPGPILFSPLGKDASMLHFIRPLLGLDHLIRWGSCACDLMFITLLRLNLFFPANSQSKSKDFARSRTKLYASTISFQTLLLRCFQMLHNTQAKKRCLAVGQHLQTFKNNTTTIQTLIQHCANSCTQPDMFRILMLLGLVKKR